MRSHHIDLFSFCSDINYKLPPLADHLLLEKRLIKHATNKKTTTEHTRREKQKEEGREKRVCVCSRGGGIGVGVSEKEN